ncbi:MAG: hypothetical protein Q9177_004961 [Variospora cf. flavescens]
MKISHSLVTLFGLSFGLSAIGNAAFAPAQRQVLVTYPEDTPHSILQEAKEAVLAAGGKINGEFTLIKGFAATVSNEILDSVTALSESHRPTVEDDSMVTIQKQDPLEE